MILCLIIFLLSSKTERKKKQNFGISFFLTSIINGLSKLLQINSLLIVVTLLKPIYRSGMPLTVITFVFPPASPRGTE